MGTIILIVIVVGAVAGVLTIGIPAAQRAAANPRIETTGISTTAVDHYTGGFLGFGASCTSQTITVKLTLVNAGSADGFADIAYNVDGARLATNTYFVRAGEQTTQTQVLPDLPDCSTHNVTVQVLGVRKG